MDRRKVLHLLHGMKRSGNHAVINWLLPQLSVAFVNNFIPVGELLRGKPMPAPRPFAGWRELQPSGDALGGWLVSLEDHDLSVQPFEGVDIPVRRLLVIRDPWQMFSSRLRKAGKVVMPAYPRANDSTMQRVVDLWKRHASCYLGEQGAYGGRIAILFDEWVRNREYREAVSDALGVRFDDGGFGRVGSEGGGSSFDGTAYDGKGHAMDVSRRMAALEPQERTILEEIFRDGDLHALGRRVMAADPFARIAG